MIDQMDWATIRGGAARILSQPDEPLEDFLVRVGVPPAYRVDLWPARFAVHLDLEPSFDVTSRTWTWSLEEPWPAERRVVASWTHGSTTAAEMAGEVLGAAREALRVRGGEAMSLYCVRSAARPFERLEAETDEEFLGRAIDTVHGGAWIEIGAESVGDRLPYARLDVTASEMALQWLAPLVGGGPPRQTISGWPRQREAAVRRVILEIQRALDVPLGHHLALRRGSVRPRVVPVKGDELKAVSGVIEDPNHWTFCSMEAPALRPSFLPRLGRSGQGSGMDEIEASRSGEASARPRRLHLLWWEGDLKQERSWLLAGPAIDRSAAGEVGSAVRAILGLDEKAPVRAAAIPVGGPDGAAIAGSQEMLGYNGLFGALFGSVIGVVGTLGMGLIAAMNGSASSGVLAIASGLVVAIVVGFATGAIGVPVAISLIERLVPSAAARMRVLESRILRGVLISLCVIIPAGASIAAAITVGRAVSPT